MRQQGEVVAQVAIGVQQALARSIEHCETIRPLHETQVRNMLDRLRATGADPELLARFETMSCTLAQLSCYHRQGRVNAYASALRRLWRSASVSPPQA